MALLSVQSVPSAGGDFSYVAAAGGGDTVPAGSTLVVKNDGGSSVNVTLDCPNACSFGVVDAAHDKVVAVPAGEMRFIPVEAKFGDANSIASVAYSDVTSVTVAAFR